MDFNVLKSSVSSRRSSILLYSAISRITAAGLPSRKTTSGLFLFVLLRIFNLLELTRSFQTVYYSPSQPTTKIGAPGPTRTATCGFVVNLLKKAIPHQNLATYKLMGYRSQLGIAWVILGYFRLRRLQNGYTCRHPSLPFFRHLPLNAREIYRT